MAELKTNQKIAVVGGGPGGYAAAFLAADLGMKFTLIDNEINPGGVCLYRGCIPSKALLHVAKLIDEAKHATNWGITFQPPQDRSRPPARVQRRRRQEIDRRTRPAFEAAQGQLRAGQGEPRRFLHHARREGSRRRRDAALRQASSSRPDRVRPSFRPSISARRASWIPPARSTSRTFPKRLLVVGGGYIGLELGSVYAAVGSKVTVVEMTAGLLPGADRDLVAPLQKRLSGMFEAIMLNTTVTGSKTPAAASK